MLTPITEFRGPHAFLSNFFPHPMEDKATGLTVPTLEHAFQMRKTQDLGWRASVGKCGTPGAAKKMGRRVPLVQNWEQIKLEVMLGLLRVKFADRGLGAMLVETWPVELIEGNGWGDDRWGVDLGTGAGQNMLGNLLMQVRRELCWEKVVDAA